VTTAVANGDLSKKITVNVRGEILELKKHDQYHGGSAFVLCGGSDAGGARKWAREGQVGGQAEVKGVAGTWKGPHRLGEFDGRQPDGAGA
jgi:hypothetical protein